VESGTPIPSNRQEDELIPPPLHLIYISVKRRKEGGEREKEEELPPARLPLLRFHLSKGKEK